MASPAFMPPSGNTGAQITAPLENQALIDFLAFTVKTDDPETVIRMMGLSFSSFSSNPTGAMGYRKSYRFGHIALFYDGNEGMGVHCSMTGQGCRQYEASFQGSDNGELWRKLLKQVVIHKGNVTRIDLAIDNIDGLLDLKKLRRAVHENNIRTRFKSAREINNYQLRGDFQESASGQADGSNTIEPATLNGSTVYFGAVSSRIQFRFYDKGAQNGLDVHWVRAESQLRDERATKAVLMLIDGQDVGFLAVGIINQYIAFINRDDSNVSRCSLQSWWSAWLSHSEKLKLSSYKAIRVVAEIMSHIKKQYAPSLALIREYLGSVGFHGFVNDLIYEGKERFKTSHEQILLVSQLVDVPF